MNKIYWNALERAINSLSMSTDIEVCTDLYQVRIGGLNSSYTSHQSISIITGHGYKNLIIINNDNQYLFISLDTTDTTIKGKVLQSEVPTELLKEVIDRLPWPVKGWVKEVIGNATFVTVAVPDYFAGYDSENEVRWETVESLNFPLSNPTKDVEFVVNFVVKENHKG